MYITGYIFGCGSMVLIEALQKKFPDSPIWIVGLVLWCAIGSTVNSWVKKHNEKNS